jgi:hypothetical protein
MFLQQLKATARVTDDHPMRTLFLIAVGLIFMGGCAGLLETLSAPTRSPAIDATAEAIESVLIQDQQNFNTTSQRLQMGVPELQAFSQYLETMKAIDLRGCPPDFREAFVRHTAAWDEVYRFAISHNEIKRWIGVGAAILKKDAVGALEGTFAPNASEHVRLKEGIHHTWVEVEVLAAKYGARKA